MRKRIKRIGAFFLNLILIVVIVQQGLVVSDASSASPVVQAEQSDTVSDGSMESASDSQEDTAQADESSTDGDSTASDSSAADSSDSVSSEEKESTGSDGDSTDAAADTQKAENGSNAGNADHTGSSSDGHAGSQSVTKDNDYTVTVTYGEDAGLPEDAKLQVQEITDASAVESYTQQAESALNGTTVSEARFFDISFVKDGQEVEPQTDVDVEIILAGSLETSDETNVKAVHFDETSGSVSPEVLDVNATKDSAGNVEKVQFTQSSFSVTGVVVANGTLLTDGKEHVVILQGSNNDYYALKHDGTLTRVSVSSDNNVTFPDFTSADQVNDYKWMTTIDSGGMSGAGTIYYKDDENQFHYLYPDETTGVVHDTAGSVYVDNDGRLSKKNDNCYLSVNNEQAVGISLASSWTWSYVQSPRSNAAKIVFADSFTIDDTQTDPNSEGDSSSQENLDAPEVSKIITDNENGTYDLSLSIKGKAKTEKTINKADVVVVFDESTSMESNRTDSGQTRLQAAKNALDALTDTLLSGQNSEQVRMKLIKFHTTAFETSDWTNDKTIFKDYYKEDRTPRYNPDQNLGGTNWEDALQKAGDSNFREDADRYVIFISDGDPTFYNNPFGEIGGKGYDSYYSDAPDNIANCYSFAKDDAQNLVKQGIYFYTVSIFNQNIGKMDPLTRYAYSGSDTGSYPADRYQDAADTDTLIDAFDNIIKEITKNFNYANVTFNDQLTAMTATDVRPDMNGKFRYTVTNARGDSVTVRDNGDGTYSYSNGTETKTFKGATCDEDGNVTWSMDQDTTTPFLLDDGYTYNCIFTVWPNQEAYDLVAELNNGEIAYSDLDDDQKNQIIEKDGEYVLATNEEGTNVTYKTATTEDGTTSIPDGDPKTQAITNPDPVKLAETMFSVSKVWDDNNDSSNRPESITLQVIRDKGTSQEVTSGEIYLSSENGWTQQYYIAPGLIVDGNKLDPGHTYDIKEEDTDVHYELESHTYHPFLINSSSAIYDGETAESDEITTLTATNKLRGSVTLVKKTEDAKGNDITTVADSDDSSKTVVNPAVADDEFTFDVTLTSPNAHTDADYGYEFYNQDQYTAESPEAASSGQLDESGKISGYSLTSSDKETTVKFSVVLKPAEQFRLSYMPIGTKVTINEESVDDYSFSQADVYFNNSSQSSSSSTELPIQSTTIANKNGKIVFTNKRKPLDLKLTKTDDTEAANVLAGAEFSLKLVKSGETDETETDAYDVYGNKIETITAGELAEIGDLPSGTYRLTETRAPDGYARGSDITFTVDHTKIGTDDASNAVRITDDSSNASVSYQDNATASPDDDSYVITVKNNKIYELPSFGGHGIYWNIVIGTLIAMFFAYKGFSMKRREERGKKT